MIMGYTIKKNSNSASQTFKILHKINEKKGNFKHKCQAKFDIC